MDDSILFAVARERLAKAEAEAAHWRSFIETFVELRRTAAPGAFVSFSSSDAQRYAEVVQDRMGKLSVTERVARSIIADAGRPVPSAELLQQLEERQVVIGGKQKSSTLAARLNRAKTLAFQRGLGWTIKDQASQNAPEANGASGALGPAQVGT